MPDSEAQKRKDRARARVAARRNRARQEETSNGLKFMAAVAIIALLLASFFVGTVLRFCAGEAQDNVTSSTAQSSSSSPNSSSQNASNSKPALSTVGARAAEKLEQAILEKEAEEEDKVKISDILEENLVKQIEAQAKVNKDTAWIAAHLSEYAYDGWAVQYKILKLAAEEPAATTYIREWPELYPAEDQNLKSPHAVTGKKTGPHNIPQLYQWDPRWGYTVYSSTAFGMTGCCPTTLAMVYQGLTGKTDMTPYDMGVLAANDGYMSENEGTDAYFLINEAQGLGLNCYEIYLATESMMASLENGDVLIANVGPGDFTNDGHFIVITGLKDGKLIVNDPYSKQRSEKLWDPDEVMNQCKAVFAYSRA